jgi:hypothetical protein
MLSLFLTAPDRAPPLQFQHCCEPRHPDLNTGMSQEYDSGGTLSTEALFDLFLAVYDECNTATLKKEKSFHDFVATCKIPTTTPANTRAVVGFTASVTANGSILINVFGFPGDLDTDIATQIKSSRLTRADFETLKVIGRGAFGEVCRATLRSEPYLRLRLGMQFVLGRQWCLACCCRCTWSDRRRMEESTQ